MCFSVTINNSHRLPSGCLNKINLITEIKSTMDRPELIIMNGY